MRREPIWLRETRFTYQPYRLLHRGIERRVRAIEQAWDGGRRPWRRAGRFMRVRCQDGTRYNLFHDVALNAWFVARPRWVARAWRRARKRQGGLRWNCI